MADAGISLVLPHATPYAVCESGGPDRVIVLCPDIHLREGNQDEAICELHRILLDDLVAIVDGLHVQNIVQEGTKPPFRVQADDIRRQGWTEASVASEVAAGRMDTLRAELYRTAISEASLHERRGRLTTALGGKWNTSDLLEAIYYRNVNCVQGEHEALSDVRDGLAVQLDRLVILVQENQSLQSIVRELFPELDARRFSGKPWSEFIGWITEKPTPADKAKHRRHSTSYRLFRTTVIELEERSQRLNFVETHAHVADLVGGLDGNTLITFGVSHIDDLAERLRAHGAVVRLDIMPHVPDRLRHPYTAGPQWPSHLPPPFEG